MFLKIGAILHFNAIVAGSHKIESEQVIFIKYSKVFFMSFGLYGILNIKIVKGIKDKY